MSYRVSAITKAGGAVSVIVSDAATAQAKISEYRDDGFTDVFVKDLNGKDVSAELLASLSGPSPTLSDG